MATLDILSRGRVDVGIGRTGYPYQLTPYGTDLKDTRGMWREFAEVLPRLWTEEEISYDGTYYKIPRREVLPKPLQRPHPPLWSACGSDETARQTGSLGMGGLFGGEGGPNRIRELMALYRDALRPALGSVAAPPPRTALMTAGYCHEDPHVAAERGSELVAGISNSSANALASSGGTTTGRLSLRITRVTMPVISASPLGHIQTSRRRARCATAANSSASARRPSASALSSCTKRSGSRR